MTFFVVSVFLSVTFFSSSSGSGAILDLHRGNFDKTTSDNQYVLVEFYAPWCGHCREFEPEFHKTAELLKENGLPVKLAKVNAEEEKSLATENDVRSYPTLKLYTNGFPIDYHGTKTADDIVNWLQTKTGPSLQNY